MGNKDGIMDAAMNIGKNEVEEINKEAYFSFAFNLKEIKKFWIEKSKEHKISDWSQKFKFLKVK